MSGQKSWWCGVWCISSQFVATLLYNLSYLCVMEDEAKNVLIEIESRKPSFYRRTYKANV